MVSSARGQRFPRLWGDTDVFQLSSSVRLDDADAATRTHLFRIRELVRDKQWDEAVETLRQVMGNHGEKVMVIDAGSIGGRYDRPDAAAGPDGGRLFIRYISIRDFCHMQIALLPPEALRLYRDRVDPLARQWYETAVKTRDRRLLEKVVAETYCSSWGDEALLALAEMALERGHHAAARTYLEEILSPADWAAVHGALKKGSAEHGYLAERIEWHQPGLKRLALPPSPARPEPADEGLYWLRYPDTNLDRAEVLGLLVLCSIREGDWTRAEQEHKALNDLHADAKARIGGTEVNLATWLAEQLAAARGNPPPRVDEDWTTFAGSPSRGTVAAITAEFSQSPSSPRVIELPVRVRYPSYAGREVRPKNPVAEGRDGALSHHPLLVGNLLLVNDWYRVFVYDLRTGKPAWQDVESINTHEVDDGPQSLSVPGDAIGVPRFTMTAHDGRLYARMGRPQTGTTPGLSAERGQGYLVCLDLRAQGKWQWKKKPDGPQWAFDGSPVTDGRNVYVAMRQSGVQPQSHVACFDATTGRRRWRTMICAAPTPAGGQRDEITHNLLTLHEDTLYFNTNLGAVAALETQDGHVRWITLYPRVTDGRLSEPYDHRYRDLNPCVFHQGKVFAAPGDTELVMAMDASTGQLLWESKAADDAVHLLGVVGKHLVASGRSLYFFNANGGKVIEKRNEADAYGRGVLAGGMVYLPTREKVIVLDGRTLAKTREIQLTRTPLDERDVRPTGGNIIVAGERVVIAAAERIFVYDPLPLKAPGQP